VDWANDSWLAAWGVEAAAVVAYDVPEVSGSGTGVAREDLFVLVNHGMVMTVSWTYPQGFVHDPAYATFASVAEATMVWDAVRWEQRGRVWPESALLGPGLFGAPKPKYQELGRDLSAATLLPVERTQVLSILSDIVAGAGAPWVPLTPDEVDGAKRAILSVIRNAQVRAFVETAFAEVRTAHDLRGIAIILGRSLDQRHAPSAPVAIPPDAGVLRPAPPARAHF
jgi:hypothetical protein